MKMENIVLKDEEICRINYSHEKGDYKRLMKQTYSNDAPFYTIEHGFGKRTPVETSDSDLNNIILQLEKEVISLEKSSNRKCNKNNTAVEKIYKEIISKEKKFIIAIKKYVTEITK